MECPVSSSVQTQSLKPEDGTTILNTQRLQRPSSPHFTIYEPQLTWIGSIFNRVTGVGLGFCACMRFSALTLTKLVPVLYGFSLAYLVAPGTFDSTHVIEFVGGLPDVVKYAGKFILALPFTFHSWNGIRHLLWDSGKCACYCSLFSDFSSFLCSLDRQGSLLYRLRSPRSYCNFYNRFDVPINVLRLDKNLCILRKQRPAIHTSLLPE